MRVQQPAPGDFGVTQIAGHIGLLIRLGQWLLGDGGADFEHAFVYVGGGAIVEAEPRGALRSPLSRYDKYRIEWWTCPPERGPAIAGVALDLIGTPYSALDYLVLAAERLRLPLAAQLLRHRVKATGRMICSQLVDEAYLRAGVHLFDDGRDPGDVTPGDLYGLIVSRRQARQ